MLFTNIMVVSNNQIIDFDSSFAIRILDTDSTIGSYLLGIMEGHDARLYKIYAKNRFVAVRKLLDHIGYDEGTFTSVSLELEEYESVDLFGDVKYEVREHTIIEYYDTARKDHKYIDIDGIDIHIL